MSSSSRLFVRQLINLTGKFNHVVVTHSQINNTQRLVTPLCFLQRFSLLDCQSVRHAGHSKWQNIRHTKAANDAKKARVNAKYSLSIVKAVVAGNSTDPKLNSELAATLERAKRANVPKETIERAVKRAMNAKIVNLKIELSGPNQAMLILSMETDSKSRARHDIKTLIKKYKGWQLARENTVVHSFSEKGLIRLDKFDREGMPINYEKIEEIAIEAEAEEVVVEDDSEMSEVLQPRLKVEETAESVDAEPVEIPCWNLRTDPADMYKVKGYIEKNYPQLVIREYFNEYIPLHKIELPETDFEEFNKVYSLLEDHEEVDNIYVNVV